MAGFHAGPLSWLNWNLEMLIFAAGTRRKGTRRKTFGVRRKSTTNSTHKWHLDGIEPRSHWWEAGALTTAPSLLPNIIQVQTTEKKEIPHNKLCLLFLRVVTRNAQFIEKHNSFPNFCFSSITIHLHRKCVCHLIWLKILSKVVELLQLIVPNKCVSKGKTKLTPNCQAYAKP